MAIISRVRNTQDLHNKYISDFTQFSMSQYKRTKALYRLRRKQSHAFSHHKSLFPPPPRCFKFSPIFIHSSVYTYTGFCLARHGIVQIIYMNRFLKVCFIQFFFCCIFNENCGKKSKIYTKSSQNTQILHEPGSQDRALFFPVLGYFQ